MFDKFIYNLLALLLILRTIVSTARTQCSGYNTMHTPTG